MAATDTALGQQARANTRKHLALIALCAVAARIPFFLAYKPIWAGDSPSYSLVYYFWAHHQFFLGERTPVYPIFLGLAQWVNRVAPSILPGTAVAYTVVTWQAILNILICLGFYFALRWVRVGERIALWATVILATLAGIPYFEMQILNHSLGFTQVTAIAIGYIALLRRINAGKKYALLAFGMGLLLGSAVLNRPELLLFTVVLVLGTAGLRLTPVGQDAACGMKYLTSALLMMLGVAPLLLAWMALMYAGIGEFRITTLDGWNKSRTVFNLFDRVGPEDRALGDVLSHTWAVQQTYGDRVNPREHMFNAFDDLKAHYAEFPIDHSVALHPSETNLKAARLGYEYLGLQRVPCAVQNNLACYENMRAKIDLGDYIGDVSTKLMRRYPGAWAYNVVYNWIHETFNFAYADLKPSVPGFEFMAVDGGSFVRSRALDKALIWVMRIESPFLIAAYTVTIVFGIAGPLWLWRRAQAATVEDWAVVLLALSAVASIALTCVLAGFNRIYSVPYLAIFVLCAACMTMHLRTKSA